MATITVRAIIQEVLDNDGVYPGDPQVSSVWEYRNASGKVMWAVFYNEAHNDLALSPFVGAYVLLWSRERGHVNPIGTLEGEHDLPY